MQACKDTVAGCEHPTLSQLRWSLEIDVAKDAVNGP